MANVAKCMRHMDGRYEAADCPICRLNREIQHVLGSVMPRAPRYLAWRIKRTPGKSERSYEYTTERAEQGKYWAIERRWIRVKGGERGKIVRKAGFKLRKKAKERAYAWYMQAREVASD